VNAARYAAVTRRTRLLCQLERAAIDRMIDVVDALLDRLWADFTEAELTDLLAALGTPAAWQTPPQAAALARFDRCLAMLAAPLPSAPCAPQPQPAAVSNPAPR
jgi:hypothetical protein